MERADVFATLSYKNASNPEDKIEAFMVGYKYAHKEMKEEIKKFTKGFGYKKESDGE